MRAWKIVLFAVVLVFAVGTIVYALNTSTAADSNCQVSKCSVSGQEIQLSSDGCCPKKGSGTEAKKDDPPKSCPKEGSKDCPKEGVKDCPKEGSKDCPKESEKGCPKKGSGCDKN